MSLAGRPKTVAQEALATDVTDEVRTVVPK